MYTKYMSCRVRGFDKAIRIYKCFLTQLHSIDEEQERATLNW